jgi:hypothetical protein
MGGYMGNSAVDVDIHGRLYGKVMDYLREHYVISERTAEIIAQEVGASRRRAVLLLRWMLENREIVHLGCRVYMLSEYVDRFSREEKAKLVAEEICRVGLRKCPSVPGILSSSELKTAISICSKYQIYR